MAVPLVRAEASAASVHLAAFEAFEVVASADLATANSVLAVIGCVVSAAALVGSSFAQ